MPRLLLSLLLLLLVSAPSTLLAQEITLWHAYRGAEAKTLDAIVARWNEGHPDQKVRSLSIPYEAFSTKLTNAIPRGHGPDVFIFAHERVGDWSQAGLIAPWAEDQAPWSTYHPISVDAVSQGPKRWAIPLSYKSLVLFYNKALVPKPPKTTDELLAIAKKHTDPKAERYGLVYQASDFYFHAPWFFGHGGQIFDPKTDAFGLDSQQGRDSYAFARSLLENHKVLPEEVTGTLVSHLFGSGKAAFAINGPWFLGDLKDKPVDFGLAPLPIVSSTGQPAKPFLTVEAAFVSAKSGPREAGARAFAAFLAEPEIAAMRALDAAQPVTTLATYKDPRVAKRPELEIFRRQLDATVPMPNRPEMRSVWEPASLALRRVMRGVETPELALKQAANRYRLYTRPAPKAKPATPLIAGTIFLLLALIVYTAYRWRRDDLWPKVRASKAAYLYLAPAVVGLMVLVIVPFVVGSAVSLFAHRQGEFTYVGLSNFFNILTSADYGITDPMSFYFTLGVTVLWTGVNVFLHVSIGMALALLLREPWLQMRAVYRVLLIIPWAVPNYITALIWKGMFHKQFGAVNGLLKAVGVEPISWFSQFSTAFAANVTTNTWLGFPFMMVVILGALQSIPRDLEEAAEVDGATWWQRFRHVVLPLLRPSLVPAIILGTVWTFNMFNIIYLVSGGEPDGATEILISESYKWAFTRQQQYGYAAAYAVLIFFVLLGYSASTGQLKTQD